MAGRGKKQAKYRSALQAGRKLAVLGGWMQGPKAMIWPGVKLDSFLPVGREREREG